MQGMPITREVCRSMEALGSEDCGFSGGEVRGFISAWMFELKVLGMFACREENNWS